MGSQIGPRDPEELDAAGAITAPRIGAGTTVELTVAELDRSLRYYETAVGLEVLERGAGRARLGAGGQELLVLVEAPGAPPAHGFTGLYPRCCCRCGASSPAGWPTPPATACR